MAALDARHKPIQLVILPMKRNRSIGNLPVQNNGTRWWQWLTWNLRLLAPNLPFSSLHHDASLSLLKVNSLITRDDFMYPIYGTSSRILSQLFNCKTRKVWKRYGTTKVHSMVADHPNSIFCLFELLSLYSCYSAHRLCFLVENRTGVRPFKPNLTKHLLLHTSPITTISSAKPTFWYRKSNEE